MNRIATVILALACAYVFKHFYSTAGAEDLRWILLPTTVLVEMLTGKVFEFESRAGYMESDHHFLIGNSCSGGNFFLTAFLLLSIVWMQKPVWINLPFSLLAAYISTVVSNAVRISLSMSLQTRAIEFGWFDAARIHRIEGILVYFGSLLLLYEIALCSGRFRTGRPHHFVKIPLITYYAVALGIPFANGAFHQGSRFWEHAVFTISLPMLIVLAVRLYRSQGVWKRLRFCPLLQRPSTGHRSIDGLQFEHHQRNSE